MYLSFKKTRKIYYIFCRANITYELFTAKKKIDVSFKNKLLIIVKMKCYL